MTKKMSAPKLIGILVLIVAIFAAVVAALTGLATLLPRSAMIGLGAVSLVLAAVAFARNPVDARKFFLPKL